MTQPHRQHGDSSEPPRGINSAGGSDRDASGKPSGARRRLDQEAPPKASHEARDDALPRNGHDERPSGPSDESLDVPHDEPRGGPHSTPHHAHSQEEPGPSHDASAEDPH